MSTLDADVENATGRRMDGRDDKHDLYLHAAIRCILFTCDHVHREVRMPTTQIELDQELLDKAAAVLGTSTKKATVNEALRKVVQDEFRRRHVDELANGALPDLANPEVMASAWR